MSGQLATTPLGSFQLAGGGSSHGASALTPPTFAAIFNPAPQALLFARNSRARLSERSTTAKIAPSLSEGFLIPARSIAEITEQTTTATLSGG